MPATNSVDILKLSILKDEVEVLKSRVKSADLREKYDPDQVRPDLLTTIRILTNRINEMEN